ncbi:MAG TPA: methyltransferase domain-containing protein [Polyangia bacterium]|jgi:23S rRNA (cytosine1962-C5)-methyltransferase|nr:methyltransferase domain-containing protein [Polyangia bacterium]
MRPDPAIAVVSARGAARLRAGHPWVFRPDVVKGPATDAGDGGPALVTVEDGRGKRLGVATWAARARLALRMLDREGPARPLGDLVDERLAAALSRRRALQLDRDAYRVVHAESDGLPGLMVDRYADAAVIQTTSVAMNAARAEIAAIVRARLDARVVVARDDGSARDFEDLPRFAGLLHGHGTRIVYRLGGNTLEADLLTDGKTGGFLDQADNQAALAALAPPGARVLDAFTYHGGFALALARRVGAGEVRAVDESEAAVARAAANARRNGLSNLKVERANSFDLLRALESAGERFDVVVIDPPALAKRGGAPALATAARAYKELVLRGARLTRAGGLLCACSCSGRITRAHWEEICTEALGDAGRTAQVLSRAGAGRDHPELAGVPETGHLKVWTYRIL